MTDTPDTEPQPKARPASAKAMAGKKATTEEPIEKQLWKTADKLRKNIDAGEHKHIVLGLATRFAPC
ncbi:MAG: SAM-dependent DNA methyltransferase [Flavobacteriales bacterium]|nr:SAM-dependent DNA methyltransferase [Flavobacteriales bacterium]